VYDVFGVKKVAKKLWKNMFFSAFSAFSTLFKSDWISVHQSQSFPFPMYFRIFSNSVILGGVWKWSPISEWDLFRMKLGNMKRIGFKGSTVPSWYPWRKGAKSEKELVTCNIVLFEVYFCSHFLKNNRKLQLTFYLVSFEYSILVYFGYSIFIQFA
jgi:hypothetical protein